jgi:hypothetical protein
VIITGPYNIRDLKLKLAKELLDPEIAYRMMQLTASNGNMRIALMDRDNEIIPIDRDDTVHLLAASWDLLEAAQGAQAVLGDLVRGGVASDDELEAYEMLVTATDKATRRGR